MESWSTAVRRLVQVGLVAGSPTISSARSRSAVVAALPSRGCRPADRDRPRLDAIARRGSGVMMSQLSDRPINKASSESKAGAARRRLSRLLDYAQVGSAVSGRLGPYRPDASSPSRPRPGRRAPRDEQQSTTGLGVGEQQQLVLTYCCFQVWTDPVEVAAGAAANESVAQRITSSLQVEHGLGIDDSPDPGGARAIL